METHTGSSRPRRVRTTQKLDSAGRRLAALRKKLVDRNAQLRQRVRKLERELARIGERPSEALHPRAEAIVAELLAATRSEFAQTASALRRMADRSFDCCMTCGATIPLEQLELFPHSVNCPGCAADFPLDYSEKLRGQHLRIRESLAIVAELIDLASGRRAALPEAQADRKVTIVILEDLEGELVEHFALEERNGYLAAAISVAPRLHRKATVLLAQHGEFRDQLAGLIRPARDAQGSSQGWVDLEVRFRRFAGELQEHERAEGELISRAHSEDLGGSGD